MSSLRIALLLLTTLQLVTQAASAAPVNINSADGPTLARELKGIGETKAAAIIEYRTKHGAFRTIDDLALVKGVGQKLVDRNRADLRVSGAAVAAPAAAPRPAAPAARPANGSGTRR
jgi:competence protein ComEA